MEATHDDPDAAHHTSLAISIILQSRCTASSKQAWNGRRLHQLTTSPLLQRQREVYEDRLRQCSEQQCKSRQGLVQIGCATMAVSQSEIFTVKYPTQGLRTEH